MTTAQANEATARTPPSGGKACPINVTRLGLVTLQTPQLDALVDHYSRVIGLVLVERAEDSALLATREGLETLLLKRGGAPALLAISFQTGVEFDSIKLVRRLAEFGVPAEVVAGKTPSIKEAVSFVDPAGSRVELFVDYTFMPRMRDNWSGIMPIKIGHVARVVEDVGLSVEFYDSVLGFRMSDQRSDIAAFMRCGPDHHTVNFFKGQRTQLAHLAFELKDGPELHRASDILARNNSKLDWGPSRHIIGHNIACYHRDPDGNRVELFAEMDQMKSEELGYFDPRPWHDQIPLRPTIWPAETGKDYWRLAGY